MHQLLHSCRMNPQYPLGWPNSQSRHVQEPQLGTMLYFNNDMLSGTITHLQSVYARMHTPSTQEQLNGT